MLNQGILRDYVEDYFTTAMETDFLGVPHDYFETTDGDHGRVEIRRHWTIDKFGDFPGKAAWKDLSTMGMVESERHIKGEVTTDRRYYITNLTANAEQFASCVRATGAWKTDCIGLWTSISAKTIAVFEKVMLRRISQPSDTLP